MERVLSVLLAGKNRGKTPATSTEITKSMVVWWKFKAMSMNNEMHFWNVVRPQISWDEGITES